MRPSLIIKFASFAISMLGTASLALAQEALPAEANSSSKKSGNGQVPAGSEKAQTEKASSERRAQIEEFHNAKAAMLEEVAQIRSKTKEGGAKAQREAVELWQKQNAARMDAVRQQAVALADAQAQALPTFGGQLEIPQNASEEVKAFLIQRARIYGESIAIEEQLKNSPQQSDAIMKDRDKRLPGALALQSQLARAVAGGAQQKVIQIPPQAQIPLGASPEVQALLNERNALLDELAKAQMKRPTGDGQTHEQWLLNWYGSQSERLRSIQQKAEQASQK